MILSTHRRRLDQRRRNAFTLLEVLVVVAILVVLASVSTIYVFRNLEEAKIKTARVQAGELAKAGKLFILSNNGSTDGLTLQALIAPPDGGKPFMEGGVDALKTPFGGQFILEVGQASNSSSEQNVVVSFKGPDGRMYSSNQK